MTTLPRLAKCGCCRTSTNVALRFSAGIAGYAGLATCGSVWVCPVCSAKIAARRQMEIQAAITAWYVLGGSVAFSTFTLRHGAGDPLATLWGAVQGAWGAVTSGKAWNLAKSRHGVHGWIRLAEVTWGSNGWHVHLHCLLFLDGGTTPAGHAALHGWMVDRWIRAVERRGFTAVSDAQDSRMIAGLDALERIAEYFTKATDHGGAGASVPKAAASDPARSVSLEFSRSHTKGVRTALGTRPPFTLLDLVLEDGDADALAMWHEWESGSHGRRQLTWSRGLRQMLALGQEVEDDAIAAEEVGTSLDDLLFITPAGWESMVRRPHLIPQLLTITEAGGLAAARRLLDLEGIDYLTGETHV